MRGIGLISGRGITNGGREYAGLMHLSDILPTLLAAAGIRPATAKLDGVSQWDAIVHDSASSPVQSPRTEVLIQSDPLAIEFRGQTGDSAKAAIRMGPWKLIVGSAGCPDNWLRPYREDGLESGVHNCSRAVAGHVQLYNVVQDVQEKDELANDHPEVVQRLLARLGELNATFPSPVYPDNDPAADPKLHGGTWTPWQ